MLAYEENERNKDKVNAELHTHMSPERAKEIMDAANSTIHDFIVLHKTLKAQDEIPQRETDSALVDIQVNYTGQYC